MGLSRSALHASFVEMIGQPPMSIRPTGACSWPRPPARHRGNRCIGGAGRRRPFGSSVRARIQAPGGQAAAAWRRQAMCRASCSLRVAHGSPGQRHLTVRRPVRQAPHRMFHSQNCDRGVNVHAKSPSGPDTASANQSVVETRECRGEVSQRFLSMANRPRSKIDDDSRYRMLSRR